MSLLKKFRRTLNDLNVTIQNTQSVNPYEKYVDKPAEFARNVLGVTWTPLQEKVAMSLIEPPYRVLVPSANNMGKSFVSASIVLWWFCTRSPCIIKTTAPTMEQVKTILWKEIRAQAGRANLRLPFMPSDCRIVRSHDDFAIGTTARGEGGWKGQHGPNILFVFDEATDVEAEFWDSTETMFQPPGHAWLAIYNPTDPASKAYIEQTRAAKAKGKKSWHVIRMSALDHPNIEAELKGLEAPFKYAIRLETLERRIPATCQLVSGTPTATDIQWPPAWATEYCERTGQQPRWWRPGPDAEATLLGRYPSQGSYSVWGDADWAAACREGMKPLTVPYDEIPQIGCDTAHGGADDTEFHVRCGPCSLDHDRINGHSTPEIVGKLKNLCKQWSHWFNHRLADIPLAIRHKPITEKDVVIKIDDAPVGYGVIDTLQADGYAVIGITAASTALESKCYPNKRSELWFVTAEMARRGEIDVSRLSEDWLDELGRQAKSASYQLDSRGRRVVDPKDVLKEKLGRSPDSMDAFNLAFAGTAIGELPDIIYQRESVYR